jgi:hypothetical protein
MHKYRLLGKKVRPIVWSSTQLKVDASDGGNEAPRRLHSSCQMQAETKHYILPRHNTASNSTPITRPYVQGEGTFSEVLFDDRSSVYAVVHTLQPSTLQVLRAQSVKNGKAVAIKCMKHTFENIEEVSTCAWTRTHGCMAGVTHTRPLCRLIVYVRSKHYDGYHLIPT